MKSEKNYSGNYHLRRLLLSEMLNGSAPEKKEMLFSQADAICTWYHSVTGRFVHMVDCITLLDNIDKQDVLSILGIESRLYWSIRKHSEPFNIPHNLQRQIVGATEHLMAVLFETVRLPDGLSSGNRPCVPCASSPYTECQARNLFLYFTREYRERRYWCVSSVTDIVAATVYAYQRLCLAISILDDKDVRETALRLTGVSPEKYQSALTLLEPFTHIAYREMIFC